MLDKIADRDTDLEALLDRLERSLDVPFEEAVALPAAAYASPAFHALEIERILHSEWHCIGRQDQFDAPGKYVTLDIAGEAVFAICDKQGEIRAYANICRHRYARLLDGAGTAGRIVCPYHAWTYGLDGGLIAATYMDEGFDPATCRLREHKVEIWRGWVYVSVADDPEPLFPRIAGIDEEMANYHLERYETLFVTEEVWDTNWKCLVENFTEAYHVFIAHKKTIEPALPTRLGRYMPGGEGYCRYVQTRLEGVPFDLQKDGRILNEDLTEEQRETYPIVAIFPAHTFSISEDRLFWLAMQPEGVGKVRLRWGVATYPGAIADADRDAQAQQIKAVLDKVNAEDRGVIERVYANAASAHAEPGRLSKLELCVWEFNRYIAKRVCGSV